MGPERRESLDATAVAAAATSSCPPPSSASSSSAKQPKGSSRGALRVNSKEIDPAGTPAARGAHAYGRRGGRSTRAAANKASVAHGASWPPSRRVRAPRSVYGRAASRTGRGPLVGRGRAAAGSPVADRGCRGRGGGRRSGGGWGRHARARAGRPGAAGSAQPGVSSGTARRDARKE